MLVVGSQTSSNSLRLVEVAEREGTRAYLVDDETDVDVAWLAGARRSGSPPAPRRPSGSSDGLSRRSPRSAARVEERTTTTESLRFRLPKEVRSMSIPLRQSVAIGRYLMPQRLKRRREVPAARRARAALPVQPRVLVLREDPVPGAHPQEADAGRAGARGDRGVRARRWSRSRAASRSSTPRCT